MLWGQAPSLAPSKQLVSVEVTSRQKPQKTLAWFVRSTDITFAVPVVRLKAMGRCRCCWCWGASSSPHRRAATGPDGEEISFLHSAPLPPGAGALAGLALLLGCFFYQRCTIRMREDPPQRVAMRRNGSSLPPTISGGQRAGDRGRTGDLVLGKPFRPRHPLLN